MTVFRVVWVVILVVLIVGIDILFLRHQTGLRLGVNVGIVLIFGAVYYFIFGRKS
jgi:hypothetical protein